LDDTPEKWRSFWRNFLELHIYSIGEVTPASWACRCLRQRSLWLAWASKAWLSQGLDAASLEKTCNCPVKFSTSEFSRVSSFPRRRESSSQFYQNDYKMKSMDFSGWLGVRRRNSRSYCNDEQQRQTGKDTISCKHFGETDY